MGYLAAASGSCSNIQMNVRRRVIQAQSGNVDRDAKERAAQLLAARIQYAGHVRARSTVRAQRPELPRGASAPKLSSTSLTGSPRSIAASPQQRHPAHDEDKMPVRRAPAHGLSMRAGRARTSRSASAQQRGLPRQPGPRPTTQPAARPRQASTGPPSAKPRRAAPQHPASASQPKQAKRTRKQRQHLRPAIPPDNRIDRGCHADVEDSDDCEAAASYANAGAGNVLDRVEQAQHALAEEQKNTSRQLAAAAGSSLAAEDKPQAQKHEAALQQALSIVRRCASPQSRLHSPDRDRASQRDANHTQQSRSIDAHHLVGAEHCVQQSGLNPGMVARMASMQSTAPLRIPTELGDQQRLNQAAPTRNAHRRTAETHVRSGDQHRTGVAQFQDDAGDLSSVDGTVHTASAAGLRGAWSAPVWPVEARSNGDAQLASPPQPSVNAAAASATRAARASRDGVGKRMRPIDSADVDTDSSGHCDTLGVDEGAQLLGAAHPAMTLQGGFTTPLQPRAQADVAVEPSTDLLASPRAARHTRAEVSSDTMRTQVFRAARAPPAQSKRAAPPATLAAAGPKFKPAKDAVHQSLSPLPVPKPEPAKPDRFSAVNMFAAEQCAPAPGRTPPLWDKALTRAIAPLRGACGASQTEPSAAAAATQCAPYAPAQPRAAPPPCPQDPVDTGTIQERSHGRPCSADGVQPGPAASAAELASALAAAEDPVDSEASFELVASLDDTVLPAPLAMDALEVASVPPPPALQRTPEQLQSLMRAQLDHLDSVRVRGFNYAQYRDCIMGLLRAECTARQVCVEPFCEQIASVQGIQEQIQALERSQNSPPRSELFTDEQVREIVERLRAGTVDDGLQRITQCVTTALACMPQSVSQGAAEPQLSAAVLHSSAQELQHDGGASSSRGGSILASEVLSVVPHALATQQGLVHAACLASADASASAVHSTDSESPSASATGIYASAPAAVQATTHAIADDPELAALSQQLAECQAIVDAKEAAAAAAKRAAAEGKIAAVRQREAELDAQAAARAPKVSEPVVDAAASPASEVASTLPSARIAPPGKHASLSIVSDARARSVVGSEHDDGVQQLASSSPERSAASADAISSHAEELQPATQAECSGSARSAALSEASSVSNPSITASTQAAESELAGPDLVLLGSTGQVRRVDHGEDLFAQSQVSGDGAASSAAAVVSTFASSAAVSRDSTDRSVHSTGSALSSAVEGPQSGEASQQHSMAPPFAQQQPRVAASASTTPSASALSVVSTEADTLSPVADVSSTRDASNETKRAANEPGTQITPHGEGPGSEALAAPVDTGGEYAAAAFPQVADAQGPLSCSHPASVVSGAVNTASDTASTVSDTSDAVQSEAAIASPATTYTSRMGAHPEAVQLASLAAEPEQVDAPETASVQPHAVGVNTELSPGPCRVAQPQVLLTAAGQSVQGEDAVHLPPSPEPAMREQALQASGGDEVDRGDLPAASLATPSAGGSTAVSAVEITGAGGVDVATESVLQSAFVQICLARALLLHFRMRL